MRGPFFCRPHTRWFASLTSLSVCVLVLRASRVSLCYPLARFAHFADGVRAGAARLACEPLSPARSLTLALLTLTTERGRLFA
jgi:hypothetical protein